LTIAQVCALVKFADQTSNPDGDFRQSRTLAVTQLANSIREEKTKAHLTHT